MPPWHRFPLLPYLLAAGGAAHLGVLDELVRAAVGRGAHRVQRLLMLFRGGGGAEAQGAAAGRKRKGDPEVQSLATSCSGCSEQAVHWTSACENGTCDSLIKGENQAGVTVAGGEGGIDLETSKTIHLLLYSAGQTAVGSALSCSSQRQAESCLRWAPRNAWPLKAGAVADRAPAVRTGRGPDPRNRAGTEGGGGPGL